MLEAIRRRARRGAQVETGPLRIELTVEERRQVARMLGTEWEVSGRAVALRLLERGLAEHGLTVRQFIEILDGAPLVARQHVRAAERQVADEERRRVLEVLDSTGVGAEVAESWIDGSGSPRLGSGDAIVLATEIASVWPALPWAGTPTRLAQLAATTTRNAHGLDPDTALGRAVARLIAATAGVDRPARPGRAWRAAWAAAGVRCDTVSSRVLTLNVPLDISAGYRLGAPLWLTLRDFLGPWRFEPTPARLFVCENPTVVEAAADELGTACPAMVCTDGVPALAALDLIVGAADAGIEIHIRADFDPAGFAIVDSLRAIAPNAVPWRFDADTYTTYFGLAAAPAALPEEARNSHGHDLHEEAILPLLLTDLRRAVKQ
ncbi:TIGR02679 domain-containing protein [Nocardia sp. NPDC006044]|uniref:TIGR02679 domain-containing protein n=1 Tax=Nocardia sp. NPDC006044 TaxID=3364306 RepID=UPI00367EAEFD